MPHVEKPRPLILIFALCLLWHGSPCWSIDNPDAPDVVAEFATRCEKFENGLQQQAQSTSDIALAYAQYEQFLDQELNQAYSAVSKHVGGKSRENLVQSQRRWLQYRDAEFTFIASNWTVANFGTSSVLSRGGYRTTIIKDRVVTLLHYLKNYRNAGK